MERPNAHQIDEQAKRIFENALPPSWVHNELSNDYGKDYHVEMTDAGNKLTGTTFIVQLKGQKKVTLNRSKKHITFSLKKKHAEYYLDKVQDQPVFLIVADVTAKKAWYAHVQPLLARDQGWRSQNKCVLPLPIGNLLSDVEQFRIAVLDSIRKTRASRPGSIQDAVKSQISKMQGIDPRFQVRGVRVDHDADHIFYDIKATEPVSLQIESNKQDPETDAKIKDLFEKGKKVTFKPGEARVVGSKLFEEAERIGFEVQSAIRFSAALTFVAKNAQGDITGRLSDVHGEFSGGTEELTFCGELKQSPLAIKLGPIVRNGVVGSSSFLLSLKTWDNQPLLSLAYFDRLYKFLRPVLESASSEVTAMINGNEIFIAESHECNGNEGLEKVVEIMEVIFKARKVCERFKINPLLKFEELTGSLVSTVNELYGVFFEGSYKRSAPHFCLTGECRAESTEQFPYEKPEHYRFVRDVSYELFGQSVDVGRLAIEVTDAILKRPKRGKRLPGTKVQLRIEGTPTSAKTIRQAGEDE